MLHFLFVPYFTSGENNDNWQTPSLYAHAYRYVNKKKLVFLSLSLFGKKQVIEGGEGKKKERLLPRLLVLFRLYRPSIRSRNVHRNTDKTVIIIQLLMCLTKRKMEMSSCTKTRGQQRTPLFLLFSFFLHRFLLLLLFHKHSEDKRGRQ